MGEKTESKDTNKSGPLKVLFISHNYIRYKGDFSGVFLHLLARKLQEKNIEVYVVAPHDKGLPEQEQIDGVNIYRFRYDSDDKEKFAYRGDMHRQVLRNPFKAFRLYKFLRVFFRLASEVIEKENIKIVSVHWIVPGGVIGKWLKKKYKERIRLYLSSHGTDIRLLTRFSFLFSYLKPAIKSSERWTVVSNYLKGLLLAKDRSLESKIEVVPLPNDESVFYPDENIVKENNLIVAVSRLTVQKRLDYLIKAVEKVAANYPEARLEIYGAGPEEENLRNLVRQENSGENIKILKPVSQEQLRVIYNRAAIVVLNSFNEGFGLILTEAMLCRTAVIGTESGGITDIIVDKKSGLLVPAENSEKLAGAISLLLEDTDLRNRLAGAGYERALENFSSQSSAERYARLYKD
jgi:glycosyltransferase involved in cell wall biosynthesis